MFMLVFGWISSKMYTVVEKRVRGQTSNKHVQFRVRKETLLLMLQTCRPSPVDMDYCTYIFQNSCGTISILSQKSSLQKIARNFLFQDQSQAGCTFFFPTNKGLWPVLSLCQISPCSNKYGGHFCCPPVTSGGQHVCDQLRSD